MRGFLFAISALVIGAFFTVWTIQRSGDVAVLKALGASTATLLKDALGQAVVLLAAGTALGTALAAGLGAARRRRPPCRSSSTPATVLVPAAVIDRPRRARRRPVHPPHHLRRPADRPGERPMSLHLTDVTLTYPDGDDPPDRPRPGQPGRPRRHA